MLYNKTIELLIKGRQIIRPSLLWRVIYYINPQYYTRKRSAITNGLKTLVHNEGDYFEEGLFVLIDILRLDNRLNEVIYYYTLGTKHFKQNREYNKLILMYKLLIDTLRTNTNIYLPETDRESLMVRYNQEISEIMADNYDFYEAIRYLEEAKAIYTTIHCFSGIENIIIKMGSLYILMNEYSKAIRCFEEIIHQKTRYNFNKKDMKVIQMYVLTLLADETHTYNIRTKLDELRKYYMNIYECEEYLFILNMVSCLENADINHFTYEAHNIEFANEPVYKQLFTDIHKNIVRASRKVCYSHLSDDHLAN